MGLFLETIRKSVPLSIIAGAQYSEDQERGLLLSEQHEVNILYQADNVIFDFMR